MDIQSWEQTRNNPKVKTPDIHTIWILSCQNQFFCSADPFPETCLTVVCTSARAGPPAVPCVGAVRSLCFPSLLFCSWIFPNTPPTYGLQSPTEENSVMNVVNLKLIIFSKVNNGKTDYQARALLRTQYYRDLMLPLTKQCYNN